MKKFYYLLMALALPVLAFTSCSGDDDDDPTATFTAAIYQTGDTICQKDFNGNPSPAYTWLVNEIAALNKSYQLKAKTTEDKALSHFDDAEKALQELQSKFSERLTTHDAGPLSFNVSYLYRVEKGHEKIKESLPYKFEHNNIGNMRTEASKKLEIEASKPLEYVSNITSSDTLDIVNLGIQDGKDCSSELNGTNIRLVNNETLEFSSKSPFTKFEIIDNENKEGYHSLVIHYAFSKTNISEWKGNWYLLVPITYKDTRGNSMLFDVKLPVVIK